MKRVVAIDGPAASGKSTVARRVAKELGFVFVNSGAMYRAFTWWVLENGIDCSNREAVLRLLDDTDFETVVRDGAGAIAVCGRDPGDGILSAAVNANVSPVSAYPEVRARLVAEQRACAERADVVMEGRDIGSVVFPDTPHKFYIDASPEVRERRRRDQGQEDSIRDRDRQDSTREAAPLKVAAGAVAIDSSEMGIEEVVGAVLSRLAENGLAPRAPGKGTRMNPIYRIGYLLSNLMARLYLRRRVVNPEKLAAPGGCLVVANHASFLDPPMIGSAFPYAIHYVARKTLMSNAFARFIYKHLQTIPIDQSKLEYSVLKRVVHLVKEGEKVLIFPEGERSRDGKLKEEGEAGVGLLIAKTDEPVLPIRVFGAYESLPRGAMFPKPRKLTLVAGDRVDMSDLLGNPELRGKDLYQALSDRAMAAIAALEMPRGD